MLEVGLPDACSEHDTDVLRRTKRCNKGARFRNAIRLTEVFDSIGAVLRFNG